MSRTAIDRYEQGIPVLATAIAGLSREELLAHPVPGTWSIQEIVLHVMDSDLVGADRMKRIAAERRPLLLGYDETLFARHLNYQQLDAALACEIFAANRRMMTAILRGLPDEAFARPGVHNERGLVTLGEEIVIYSDHLDHHLRFVRQKRALLGKPLAD